MSCRARNPSALQSLKSRPPPLGTSTRHSRTNKLSFEGGLAREEFELARTESFPASRTKLCGHFIYADTLHFALFSQGVYSFAGPSIRAFPEFLSWGVRMNISTK